jgi:hypothetical protein
VHPWHSEPNAVSVFNDLAVELSTNVSQATTATTSVVIDCVLVNYISQH